MAKTKKITKRFIEATFRRGQKDFLPLSYFTEQMAYFCPKEEMAKLEGMMEEMVADGVVEKKDGMYKLANTSGESTA